MNKSKNKFKNSKNSRSFQTNQSNASKHLTVKNSNAFQTNSQNIQSQNEGLLDSLLQMKGDQNPQQSQFMKKSKDIEIIDKSSQEIPSEIYQEIENFKQQQFSQLDRSTMIQTVSLTLLLKRIMQNQIQQKEKLLQEKNIYNEDVKELKKTRKELTIMLKDREKIYEEEFNFKKLNFFTIDPKGLELELMEIENKYQQKDEYSQKIIEQNNNLKKRAMNRAARMIQLHDELKFIKNKYENISLY